MIHWLVVFGCVFGGFAVHGNIDVFSQPSEFVIILGAGLGAFIIVYQRPVMRGIASRLGKVCKGSSYTKDVYLEVLGVLYVTFHLANTKGDLALESHLNNPHESQLLVHFPKFQSNQHTVEFFCDYLRLLTLGAKNPLEIEAVMDWELEKNHKEEHTIVTAIQTVSDAMPALGFVAAVLVNIVTMSAIMEPLEVFREVIIAALFGTFSGILISYGLLAPIAASLQATYDVDVHCMTCIKVGLVGHMQGYTPQVSVELARNALESRTRPSFQEVEEMIQNLTTVS
tara:strand:+ start:803 stop:1654 length:852 start_codon:yes stop_codon:yes gene_type:complete